MNYCRYCGTKLEENAKFCTQCGNNIQPNNNVNNNQFATINYQNYPEDKSVKGGKGFIIAAICMFLASYVLLLAGSSLFLLMRLALIGVLVTGLIAYPKNTIIKVLFWGYIFILIIDIIIVVFLIMTCYNLAQFFDGCYSGN